MKIKNILVPVDFSPCSNNALKYAMEFHKKINAKLMLLHGFRVPIPAAEISFDVHPGMIDDYEKEVVEKFKQLESEIPGLEAENYDYKIEMAFAIDAILKTIEEHDIELVIMGTKGAGNVATAILGSNTYEVIKRAPCPVIAVPEDYTLSGIDRMAIATDYHKVEDYEGLDCFGAIAKEFHAEVHILNINKNPSAMEVKEAEEAVDLHNFFKKEDIEHHFDFSQEEDIATGISNFVEEKKIDLLGMIPQKHHWFDNLFHRSITRKIALHLKVPLLTFR